MLIRAFGSYYVFAACLMATLYTFGVLCYLWRETAKLEQVDDDSYFAPDFVHNGEGI